MLPIWIFNANLLVFLQISLQIDIIYAFGVTKKIKFPS